MIHSHNNQEHERIMDAASSIQGAVDALYKEYHNGDTKLNNHISILQKYTTQLIDRLEHHVQSTQPLDDIYRNYKMMQRCAYWLLGIGGSVLTGFIISQIK